MTDVDDNLGMDSDSESVDTINLDDAAAFLRNLVREAGELLLGYRQSRQFAAIEKSGVDVTTEADQRVDRFLHERLSARYPHSAFLTEETARPDVSGIQAEATANYLWVIDPLDGTVNFTRGHPNFAISVALIHKGEMALGAVYVPASGRLYQAQANQDGAYLNGEPIHVSQTASLREAVVGFDWSWDLEKRKQIIYWLERLSGHVRQLKCMGSAAADLSSLADGQIDGYIHSGLKPWDAAAAALIVQKAGGIIASPDGSAWTPFNPSILAANPHLHQQIMDLMT
jgi:myo-inositol-1(or 4)-monophosphatase